MGELGIGKRCAMKAVRILSRIFEGRSQWWAGAERRNRGEG